MLVSWAVPKGPVAVAEGCAGSACASPTTTSRSADVEGADADDDDGGGDGGGGVIVWDRGTWEPEGRHRRRARRPRERQALVRAARREARRPLAPRAHGSRSASASWLLFKGRDEHADDTIDITAARPHSVISGRTLAELLQTRN